MIKTLSFVLMNKNVSLTLLAIIMSSITLFAFLAEGYQNTPKPLNNDKINLALRQTAHHLLLLAGDSSSHIAPIKIIQENTFLVRLENKLNYDSLPTYINRSLATNGISIEYDVAVWDCEHKELLLGYTSMEYLRNNKVTCNGRSLPSGCYNFSVTFASNPKKAQNTHWILLAALSLIIIGGSFYFLNKKKISITPNKENFPEDSHVVFIGHSVFDFPNQSLITGDLQQKLTYREAKLLRLFCHHPNQLLHRDTILKEIWEDEGILVGRSLDVFVSRLRKILKYDESLKITNIHGQGYKFEVDII